MRAFQQQGQSHAGKHICPFYLKNRCIYGDRCINSHCLPENKSFQTSKSIPCKFYLQGYCHNGIKCAFSHNINANSSHTYRRDLKEAIDSKYPNSQSNNLTRCLTNIDTNIVSKTNNKPVSPGLTGFSFRQTESSYDQLSEKELSIYRSAGNFVPGTIPLSSPSENLCTFS
ncbi:unnamed protein product [Schistosoma mattheei]|uniref:Nucleoporin NUP42 n=1 Tax=Schistosoma mattheei TaxID=31246 RepID=A0AA85B3C7_9TREM|nr:unnamed protein product [Schistosoma mattheei]